MNRLIFLIPIPLLFCITTVFAQQQGEFLDPRDGEKYETITIHNPLKRESITWLGENLRYKMEGSYVYDNDLSYAKGIGRLYNWKSAMNACPKGWHLPTNDEWAFVIEHFGGKKIAGKKMKSINGWLNDNSVNNEGKFNILPGGMRKEDGEFKAIRNVALFWTSSSFTDNIGGKEYFNVWVWRFKYSSGKAYNYPAQLLEGGSSVRCIKD